MNWTRIVWLECLVFLLLGAVACNEVAIEDYNTPVPDNTGAVAGRVCSAAGDGWVENAHVYTNLQDPSGVVVGIRETYTDRDGYFVLTGVPEAPAVTVYVQKGTYQTSLEAQVVAGKLTTLPDPPCHDPLSISTMVVLGEYDTFSRMLDEVGMTAYSQVDGTEFEPLHAFFSDLNALLGFDLICVNGGIVEEGIVDDPDILSNMAAYVDAGGVLFVTDWAYDLVEQSFPDVIDFLGEDTTLSAAERGVAEIVSDALVADQSLASYLQSSMVEIRYDLAYWPLIEGAAGQVVVHITGNVHYTAEDGVTVLDSPGAPLLVSFAQGYGKVVFSTFREEANLTSDMAAVFQYMLYYL